MDDLAVSRGKTAATHTPGPWSLFAFEESFNNADGKRSGWHVNQQGGPGFILTFYKVDHRAAECEANARLIAAAPQLLAELEKAADTFADVSRFFACLGKHEGAAAFKVAEQSARAAIAKATPENAAE